MRPQNSQCLKLLVTECWSPSAGKGRLARSLSKNSSTRQLSDLVSTENVNVS